MSIKGIPSPLWRGIPLLSSQISGSLLDIQVGEEDKQDCSDDAQNRTNNHDEDVVVDSSSEDYSEAAKEGKEERDKELHICAHGISLSSVRFPS